MGKKFVMVIFAVAVAVSFIWILQSSGEETWRLETTDPGVAASECVAGEEYDAEEQVCYITCDSEAACNALAAEIQEEADAVGEEYYGDEKQYQDAEVSGETPLVTYTVTGDTIRNRTDVSGTSDEQQEQTVWTLFTTLIPQIYRNHVVGYDIISDGRDGTLAAVYQDESDPARWRLAVDLEDAYTESGQLARQDLTYSLIHEFAHLLTLRAGQLRYTDTTGIPPSERINATDCNKSYATDEGCALSDAYLNRFVQQYWTPIWSDYAASIDTASEVLYARYPTQFITEYAATNPEEDIAETFTAFVLQKKPQGTTVADQKIAFFYASPDMVTVREAIRARLSTVRKRVR